jgi:hypothetical protein
MKLLALIGSFLVAGTIVLSFLWQMLLGLCPVP